jgi:hypothetical protein
MTAIGAVIAVYECCPAYRDNRIGQLKQLLLLFGVFACSAGSVLLRLASPPRRHAADSAVHGECEELYRIRPRLLRR